MAVDVNRGRGPREPEDLVVCSVCDDYIRQQDAFKCPKCKREPLCKKHRVPGQRECASCVFEMKAEELAGFKRQEQSIKGFMNFMQFMFIVFAILFVTSETGLTDMIDFLKFSFITESLNYMGALSVTGYLLFYVILYNQRRKISEMESQIVKTEFRRRVK